MTTATKAPPSARIYPIPSYFGGDMTHAEHHWEEAYAALMARAKGDPVLSLIARELVTTWADCVHDAAVYGQAVGPGASLAVDELEPEEYEARTGKRTPEDPVTAT